LASLAESNEKKRGKESKEEMTLAHKPGKLLPCPEDPTGVRKMRIPAVGESDEEQESSMEVVSTLTTTAAGPAAEKSAETLKNPSLPPPCSITPTSSGTATQKLAKMKKELTARTKEVEDMRRMVAEVEEKAIAEEKAAAERAAAEKAAEEKAVTERAAAELAKANAEANSKTVGKSLKYTVESIKYSISAYLAQRKAEAADKTLVGKLDEELTPYFRDALSTTAIELQKRKFNDEESDDGRPSKAAKK
ncbi:hypothetical protein V498_08373, partial [Pseudogymnoascus sp. VKM F-4517 (FW-2822)]